MENKLTFADISQEQEKLEELFIDLIDQETGEVQDAQVIEELQEEIQKQLIKKSTGVLYFMREREMTLESLDAEIKRLQAIKKTYKNNLSSFKNYVVYIMERMGVKKIETPRGILSLRKSSVVDVPDASKLDMKYMKEKIEYSVDKTKIKKDIKEGKEVNGACIKDKNNLTIK